MSEHEHTHWIIDEFQDFNAAEVNLIRSVTTSADGVLVAGDDEQALYEQLKASLPAIIISFYDELRSRGKSHRQALRQLANRWVGIFHACIENGEFYDERTAWGQRKQVAA